MDLDKRCLVARLVASISRVSTTHRLAVVSGTGQGYGDYSPTHSRQTPYALSGTGSGSYVLNKGENLLGLQRLAVSGREILGPQYASSVRRNPLDIREVGTEHSGTMR
eukprot:256178-Rhodomonas_salina.1